MQQHTAIPTRKITMNYTQLTQEERYHIQDLSCHHTIMLPFAATSSKDKSNGSTLWQHLRICSKSYRKR